LTFDELREQRRVLIGTPEEVQRQLEYVRERLYLTDVAGNFALGGLTDAQTRASMRRFMERVAPEIG
jgi:alkanesulfonate monooxygenase SsuD/methylene tetrahydromethanopterin reductase-like flavin-dependent oxidoreductase (luciferase family)